ncbi:MAG: response regulator transcription factor [Planctomycetes bacterium]|nr:response regulator transcription factor [Planctomycetota bacterium]
MSVKILLADDHEIVRYGVRTLLESKGKDWEVVGEAANGRRALEMVEQLRPNLVIMDIAMPDLNGIDATRKIKKDHPEVKVIALSMYNKKQFIVDMLKSGISAYVMKNNVTDDLIAAIEAALEGGLFLSPAIAGMIARDYVQDTLPEATNTVFAVLTVKEREVLQQIAEGNSTKRIALKFKVSDKAIEATRRRIMVKLDIDNVAELTKYAVREGITTLEF